MTRESVGGVETPESLERPGLRLAHADDFGNRIHMPEDVMAAKAIRGFQRALEISIDADGEDHPRTQRIIKNLEVLLKKRRNPKALNQLNNLLSRLGK